MDSWYVKNHSWKKKEMKKTNYGRKKNMKTHGWLAEYFTQVPCRFAGLTAGHVLPPHVLPTPSKAGPLLFLYWVVWWIRSALYKVYSLLFSWCGKTFSTTTQIHSTKNSVLPRSEWLPRKGTLPPLILQHTVTVQCWHGGTEAQEQK